MEKKVWKMGFLDLKSMELFRIIKEKQQLETKEARQTLMSQTDHNH